MMFRFHPSVKWERGYPDRQQILSQVKQLWERYGLETRTKFNTPVEKIYQDEKGRWVVNNTANGHFEGVIAAVGTCGEPKMPQLPGLQDFKGHVYHSSQLTGYDRFRPSLPATMLTMMQKERQRQEDGRHWRRCQRS